MNKTKIVGIIATVLIIAVCFGVVFWYAYIATFGKEKFVTNTFYVGELETTSGDRKNIIEVNYYMNQNNDGYELFEIKLNGFTDGEENNFYSQGIQYVGNSIQDKIKWYTIDDYITDLSKVTSTSEIDKLSKIAEDMNFVSENFWETGVWFWHRTLDAVYMSPTVLSDSVSRYNYQQLNNEDVTGSSNPLNDDSYIVANFGGNEDPIYIQLKGANYVSKNDFANHQEFLEDKNAVVHAGDDNIYDYYNIDYISYCLYEQIQALPAGTNGTYVFEFGDLFNYYASEDDMTSGVQLNQSDSLKVEQNMRSYYSISVTISANGAKNAKDSIFGVLHGSPTHSIDNSSGSSGDYFVGKQHITVDVFDFDFVKVVDNDYALKLNKNFLDLYLSKSDLIVLSIYIDENVLSELGFNFVGFTKDSGLDNFTVLSIESSSGENFNLEVA